MNFIDDHRLDGRKHLAPATSREQDIERLGRGDQQVGRLAEHRGPFALRRVAGANRYPDVRQLGIQRGQFGERPLQIFLHVVAESPQRRDVDDAGLVRKRFALTSEVVDRREIASNRFAGAGGGGNQRVMPLANQRPATALGFGGFAKAIGKPTLNRRIKIGQRHTRIIRGRC